MTIIKIYNQIANAMYLYEINNQPNKQCALNAYTIFFKHFEDNLALKKHFGFSPAEVEAIGTLEV